jgi:hypothetical protein
VTQSLARQGQAELSPDIWKNRASLRRSLFGLLYTGCHHKVKKISKMFDFEAKADSKNRHRQTRYRYLCMLASV